ncbi:MAG: response regulator, partial [Bdellovibrionales bacterium]|nr:response regulator [Bdellovibrionales bacterium]
SDVHMPEMDGGAFLEAVRRRVRGIPILMLTSDEDEQLEAELVAAGADAFVRKHDDVRVLLAWCSNLAARRSGEQSGHA